MKVAIETAANPKYDIVLQSLGDIKTWALGFTLASLSAAYDLYIKRYR